MAREREAGQLLIEVMVIALVIMLALLGILTEARSAIRGNRIADQQSVAFALAQSKIEDLERQPFANVATGVEGSTLAADGTAGGLYSRSWSVTDQTVNGVAAKVVSVTVTWQQGGGNANVTLSTRLVDIPHYQPGFPIVVGRSWRRA